MWKSSGKNHLIIKYAVLCYGFSVLYTYRFSSVAQSCLTLCNPMDCKHARPPCPLPTPRVHPNHVHGVGDAIQPSHSVIPFFFCLQIYPASGFFSVIQFFTSGGQTIGVSASASVLSMNTQDWAPLGWTGWISLQSKGLKSLLQPHSSKASILRCSAFFIGQLSHPYMTTGKTIALINMDMFAYTDIGIMCISLYVFYVNLCGKCLEEYEWMPSVIILKW